MKLTASLRPVPGGTGSGTASFTIRLATRQLCYTVTLSGVEDITAADVRRAASGAVVIRLVAVATPSVGSSTACDTYARPLLRELIASPSAFRVVVHTQSFPAGELRGLLER